jgi:hypothetical protein
VFTPDDLSLSQQNRNTSTSLKRPAWLDARESPQAIHDAVSKLINFMSQPQDGNEIEVTKTSTNK